MQRQQNVLLSSGRMAKVIVLYAHVCCVCCVWKRETARARASRICCSPQAAWQRWYKHMCTCVFCVLCERERESARACAHASEVWNSLTHTNTLCIMYFYMYCVFLHFIMCQQNVQKTCVFQNVFCTFWPVKIRHLMTLRHPVGVSREILCYTYRRTCMCVCVCVRCLNICVCVREKVDRKKPPPRGGFLFTVFPDQEPGGRKPPLKHYSSNWSILGVVLQGLSSSSGFLIFKPPNK